MDERRGPESSCSERRNIAEEMEKERSERTRSAAIGVTKRVPNSSAEIGTQHPYLRTFGTRENHAEDLGKILLANSAEGREAAL